LKNILCEKTAKSSRFPNVKVTLQQMNSRILQPIFVLIVISFLLIQCKYSPTGSNFQDKTIPEPVLYIDLNGSPDTITVWGQATLAYNLDLLGRNFYEGELLLENVTIYSFSQPTGSYSFYTNNYVSDTLSLIIKGFSSSGSNSLADIAGLEYLMFEREYTLIIDNRPPISLAMLNISTESGDMVINWEKFNRNGFVRYNIDKGHPTSGGFIDERHLTSTFDINQTSIVDTTYLGGPAYYRVNIISELGSALGEFMFYEESAPTFYLSNDTNYNEIHLQWSPCHYPQNFAHYSIQVDDNSIYTTDNINDTSYLDIDAWFGDPIEYILEVGLKNNSIWSDNLHSNIDAFLGETFPHPGSLQFSESQLSFYRLYGQTLYRHDAESYSILDSLNIMSEASYRQFGISPDGQLAYIMSYSNDVGYLQSVDPLSLSILQTWTTSSLLGYNGRAMDDISVSNNNWITFPSYRDSDNVNWGMGVVVIQMNDPIQVINPNYAYSTSAKISANGQYLIAYDSLYVVSSNHLAGRADLGQWIESIFVGDGNQFIVADDQTMTVYSAADMGIVNQVLTSEKLRRPNYDPTTGYVGGKFLSSDRYMIYDPISGIAIHDISISSGAYKLWDDKIFTSGYVLPIEALND